MDIITLAREIGKEIQKDERYERLQAISQKNDGDIELQSLISQFNAQRLEINKEITKPEKDQAKLAAMDTDFKTLYNTIMELPGMVEFNEAKNDMDKLLSFVSQIITQSASGADPDSIEQADDCGGDCSACHGCH